MMNLHPEGENRIRRFLLGEATPEEKRQVEENLLLDDEFVDLVVQIEDELIDDYARGALPEQEQRLFRENFPITPERQRKLMIAEVAVGYAGSQLATADAATTEASKGAEREDITEEEQLVFHSAVIRRGNRYGWWRALSVPSWKIAVWAAVVVGIIAGAQFWWHRESDVQKAQASLYQAYSKQRPIEARVTGFSYAAFTPPSKQLGGKEIRSGSSNHEQIDYVALERAKTLLFGRNIDFTDRAVLHALGKYYITQKEFGKAIDQLQQALKSDPESAQLHCDLGAAFLGKIESDRLTERGPREIDVDECFLHLNKALTLNPGLLEALFNRALLNQREWLRREAQTDWNLYLQLDTNSAWAEEARLNLKQVESELRKASQRKEDLYQDLLAASRVRNDDRALRAFSLSYSFNGNYIVEKLLDEFIAAKLAGRKDAAKETLQLLHYIGTLAARKTGDKYVADLEYYYRRASLDQIATLARARQLMTEANSYYRKAENDRAVASYEHAKRLFAQVGNYGEELFADAWIGHCHHQRSATQENLQAFLPLVPVLTEKRYRWMLANALCGLANGHNSAGHFSQAIADCVQCGKIANELGDQTGALRSQYMLSAFYFELGKHEDNLRLTERGLNRAEEIAADIRYAIPFYNYRAWSLSALGFQEAAAAFQREAVRMAEETKSLRLIAHTYIYQGLTYARSRRYPEAIASARHGIDIGRRLKDDGSGQEFVHNGLLKLGHIHLAAGNLPEALQAFNQVIDFYRHSKKQAYFYGAAKGRLLTLIAQGEKASARAELERVLALYERYRQSIQEESNRNSFFDQEQNTYDVAINFAYTSLNDPEQAYTYTELSRGRSLLDEMNGGAEGSEGPLHPELLIEASVRPRGNDEIRRLMPDEVQLFEYAVLSDKVIVWLISKNSFVSKAINVPVDELGERINNYLTLIKQNPSKTDHRWREKAIELYDLLIEPVEPLLNKQKKICIIPDKALSRLPFGTLISRTTGRLLTEDYLLSYASSANTFIESTAKAKVKVAPRRERLLAVGNPKFDLAIFPELKDVPAQREEAITIAANYESPFLLLGEQATKSAVLREMERADVIHLAMHYVPDPWSQMNSRLPLAPEQSVKHHSALQLYELYYLKLSQPRLVVLSACQTRGEQYYGGEGAVGISRPFEVAGIPLVIATLWPVDSEATSELMISFHRNRKKGGLTTTEALRRAQLELFNHDSNYRHPYYWAAFIAIGGYVNY